MTGSWASQSISRSGWSAPQLGGDRHVALGVTEADRGGDVQGAPAPRRAPASTFATSSMVLMRARPSGWNGRSRGSAGWRGPGGGPGSGGPRPRRSTRRRTGELRQPVGAGDRLAVIARCRERCSSGQRTSRQTRLDRLERPGILDVRRRRASRRRTRRAPSPTMSSIDLRGMRLGGELAEEEPDEAGIVAPPVVLG